MSMYTQLLEAAFTQRLPIEAGTPERGALDEVLRCRRELHKGVPSGADGDTVPVALALQVGYDVALLELARALAIETDPSRFDQPESERERLERAFGDFGMNLHVTTGEESGPQRS